MPDQGREAATVADDGALLSITDLQVTFETRRGVVRAVDGVTFDVKPGEIAAMVGESGSGKSVTALGLLRLLPKGAGRITGGRAVFRGRNLLELSDGDLRSIRGREIAMVFQEPMSSLNPVLAIGDQMTEPLLIHLRLPPAEAWRRAAALLADVGIVDAEGCLRRYPHQLSGGMRQRVMIAMALTCNPKMIIADEPTTALDVTTQAQILELLFKLTRERGIALLIITHNLGVVARYADRVNVMYAGALVEQGDVGELFGAPKHPYTKGLLRAVPRLDLPPSGRLDTIEGVPPDLAHPAPGCRFSPRCPLRAPVCDVRPPLQPVGDRHHAACHRHADVSQAFAEAVKPPCGETASAGTLLSVRDLSKHFAGPRRRGAPVRAVDAVSFDIDQGRTLGLVGESGSGKTTVGRMLLGLEAPSAGRITFDGFDLTGGGGRWTRGRRAGIQAVFQDPSSSLNPRMTIGDTIAEPLVVHRRGITRAAAVTRTEELLDRVGLHPSLRGRYPHQLSGGQRQRVGIARALALDPRFLICDEAVSALDVSIQAQIMNLLKDLQRELGLAYLFIGHDLAVVRHISHRVAVLYLGRVVEVASRDALYTAPLHPYTRSLLDAAPLPDPVAERRRPPPAGGETPAVRPEGCVFHTRCPIAVAECRRVVPPLRTIHGDHAVACLRV